jgi:hypothetical protein
MNIDWTPPSPRPGILGAWDAFVGPGQTRAEFWLCLIPAVLVGLGLPLAAWHFELGWTPVQVLAAGLLAFDLVGGVVTNATAAAKRWYHRPGQGSRQFLGFTAVHGMHLALVAWLFQDGDWRFFSVYYIYLLSASMVLLKVRLYLQRPVALVLWVGVFLVSLSLLPASRGMEWFVPVFFLKLLVSHLVREAPFSADAVH